MAFTGFVRYGLVVASAGAGLAHLTAASAHREHMLVLAFFVAIGLGQLAWAAAIGVEHPRLPTRALLLGGAAGNALAVAIWAVSRTSGIPFVPGAEAAEPVGVKDTVTVLLELMVVAGAVLLLAWRRSDGLLPRSRVPGRAVAQLTAAIGVLAIPGLILPVAHEGGHGGPGHEAQHELAASDHEHAAPDAEHGHSEGADHDMHANSTEAHTNHTHVAGVAHEQGHADHVAQAPGSAPAKKVARGRAAKVRYGPFVLAPASAGGEAHVNRILYEVPKPCEDCYITAMRPNLVYEDGSVANLDTGPMLHHVVWTRPWIEDTTCGRDIGIGVAGMRFFASGNERTPFELPAGFGYLVGSDPWSMIVEIMNHAQEPKSVYITLDVTYEPSSAGLKNVTPVWLDVDNCADSEYAVPAGKSHQLWTWTSTLTGRVVATGGHVHNGGVKTVLTNEADGQRMCTSVAGYGSKPEFEGTIETMSTCLWDRVGTVREGEDLGIHAYYDSSVAQDDVMGIMVAMVYETSDLDGGTAYSDRPPAEDEPPPVHEH